MSSNDADFVFGMDLDEVPRGGPPNGDNTPPATDRQAVDPSQGLATPSRTSLKGRRGLEPVGVPEALTFEEEEEIRGRFYLARLPDRDQPPKYRDVLDGLAQALRGGTRRFAPPSWTFSLPEPRRTCLRCGARGREYHSAKSCNMAVACLYCQSDHHHTSVCPSLAHGCPICCCRGHQPGLYCPTDVETFVEARERFESHADAHWLTSRRKQFPFVGFYFFETLWATHRRLDISYEELIALPPPEALVKVRLANHPQLFIDSVNASREERRNGNGKSEQEQRETYGEARLKRRLLDQEAELEKLRQELEEARAAKI